MSRGTCSLALCAALWAVAPVGESVAWAGPPAHAGRPSRSRGPARGPASPDPIPPVTSDLPNVPRSGMGKGRAGKGGMGKGAVTGGPPGPGAPEGDEHSGHHPGEDSDDGDQYLPGTNLPRLLSGQPLSAATRAMLESRAEQNVVQGRSEIVDGLRRLADARADDSDELDAAAAQVRQGTAGLSKGLALRRSLANPGLAQDSALEWIRQDLRLRPPRTAGTQSGGLTAFHVGIMAILIAFAGVMLWMYFFKMRRAASLLHTLESAASAPGQRAAQPPKRSSGWRGELKIAAIFQETDTVKTFRFCQANGESIPFTYLPGQFLTVKVAPDGKPVQRSYTIASSPTQRDYVEITVKREQQGVVSRFLHDRVREGEVLSVSAPAGRFTFTGQEADAIVLIGGGVGITPMMSVVRYLTDRAWRGTVDLVVACRHHSDVIFAQELATLAQRHENFRYTVVPSSPSADWTGARGRLTKQTILEVVPEVAQRRVHMCGPPKMMEAVTASLIDAGVSADQIFTEKFGPAGRGGARRGGAERDGAGREAAAKDATPAAAKPDKTTHLPVVSFRASGKKASAGPDVTVLDAAESAGVEIDSSCRVGTCGTCMVRLLEGEVTMAVEDGLHPDDKADGFILACQACTKADVVVDV